ncbi:MAG: SGNH/GDSL hydrolase family protein [Lachnospiraceae bacterium]|nr:SGNH/GDSL hydrolase family protein [Lachnospiraceae bacterium]
MFEDDGYFPVIQAFGSIGGIGDRLMAGYCYNNGNVVHSCTGRESKNNWIEYMCKRNGIVCRNYAVGGSTFQMWRSMLFESMGVAKERSDSYVIALGVNDSEGNVGTIDDIDRDNPEKNADSYYGSCHWLLQKLNQTFGTDIRIFLLTDPGRTLQEQKAAADRNRALQEISVLFENVLTVDLAGDFAMKYYRNGLISRAFRNGHYSPVAEAYMSKLIEYELNRYMIDHYDMFQGVPYRSDVVYPDAG